VDNHITLSQVTARLEENSLRYALVSLQGAASIVLMERGGRVLGPFTHSDGESISWLHEAFGDAGHFAALLAQGAWNVGGERIWLAPEIQYGVRDRSDFWRTLHVPAQVDPGSYALDQSSSGEWRMHQKMTLQAYNLATGRKTLVLKKRICPAEDPLRKTSEHAALLREVAFAGYEQTVMLSEEGAADDIVSESWDLLQVNPGGVVLIPASPCAETVNYYDPAGDLQSVAAHHIRLRITGRRRYKVGFKAAHVFGRAGYLNETTPGQGYLIVRTFFNNPSAPYVEEPANLPGGGGQSIHIYNDDGAFGGFGELECQGQAIGGGTGRSASEDRFVLWLYQGQLSALREISLHLLGCTGLEGGR
jgi:hypothetical protein